MLIDKAATHHQFDSRRLLAVLQLVVKIMLREEHRRPVVLPAQHALEEPGPCRNRVRILIDPVEYVFKATRTIVPADETVGMVEYVRPHFVQISGFRGRILLQGSRNIYVYDQSIGLNQAADKGKEAERQ